MTLLPTQSLPRNERIARRRDFVEIYENGTRQHGRFTVVFFRPNAMGHPRIGVTATRKFGKAHDRNKVKRWVREVYRRNRGPLGLSTVSIDFVVNIKGAATDARFDDFSRDLVRSFRKALDRPRPVQPETPPS